MRLKIHSNRESVGEKIILYLKKQNIIPLSIINTINRNNKLIIVVKDDIKLIAFMQKFRRDIKEIGEDISINWSLINDSLIKISFTIN